MPALLTAGFSRAPALTLGAATSDRISCGSAADITGFTVLSVGLLVKATTLANVMFASKTDAVGKGMFFLQSDTVGNVRIGYGGATIMQYTSSNTPLKANTWQFVAATVDTSLGASLKAHLYTSTSQTTPLLEVVYAAPQEGATPAADTAAETLRWGQDGGAAPTSAFRGQIQLAWYAPGTAYSLQELQRWQRTPLQLLTGMKVFLVCDSVTGTLKDRTGLGHDGTVT